MAFAFRCVNCNTLAESGHAGELDKPAKCATCGRGVTFSPDGIKTYDPDNWVVLADLEGDDLQAVLDYHAIDASDVEAHVPAAAASPDHEPVAIAAVAVEASGQKDKTR